MKRTLKVIFSVTLLFVMALSGNAMASSDYPNRAITLIVPYPAGGVIFFYAGKPSLQCRNPPLLLMMPCGIVDFLEDFLCPGDPLLRFLYDSRAALFD